MPVTVLVPIKGSAGAKSRLSVPDERRAALVEAMAADVLSAVEATGLPVVRVGGGPDLDTAVRVAAEAVPGPVVVVMADLPCLTAGDLLALLERADGLERWVVADADGTGTALLGAGAGPALRPAYGPGSRARHADGATDLTEVAAGGLRRDVDTTEDLAAAAHVGLGARTAAVHLSLP